MSNDKYYLYFYRLDKFDRYDFIFMGFFGLLFSSLIIWIHLKYKQLRRHPGNLVLMLAISDLALVLHWISHFIYNEIYEYDYNSLNNSLFCKINSIIAAYFGSLGIFNNISWFICLLINLKSGLKKIKSNKYIFFVPIILSFLVCFHYRNDFGLTYNGTCSVNLGGEKSIINHIITLIVLVIFSLITLIILKKNIKKFSNSENEFIKKNKNYWNFYYNYILYCFINYILIGLLNISFFLYLKANNYSLNYDNLVNTEGNKTDIVFLFSILKLANILKVSMPIITFALRIQDPCIYEEITNLFKSKFEKETILQRKKTENSNFEVDLLEIQLKESWNENYKNSIILILYYYFKHIINICNDKKEIINMKGIELQEILNFECILLNFKLTIYGNKLFKILITNDIINEFIYSININSLIKKNLDKKEGDGGASGEFFYFTNNKEFLIKTISEEEKYLFLKILKSYCNHFDVNNESLITKIYGIYEINFYNNDVKMNLIIMKNLFKINPSKFSRKYDIKGSKFSRQVIKDVKLTEKIKLNNERYSIVLKDLDFFKIEKKLDLDFNTSNLIYNTIKKDVEFFRYNKIIDYSLIVGIILYSELDQNEINILENANNAFLNQNKTEYYVIALIDYFQLYNFMKKLEKYSKKWMHLNINLDTSSQNSINYSDRFLKNLGSILNIK